MSSVARINRALALERKLAAQAHRHALAGRYEQAADLYRRASEVRV